MTPWWLWTLPMIFTSALTAIGTVYLMRSQRRGEDRRSLGDLLERGASEVIESLRGELGRLRAELGRAQSSLDEVRTKLDAALARISRLEYWIRAQGADPQGIDGHEEGHTR